LSRFLLTCGGKNTCQAWANRPGRKVSSSRCYSTRRVSKIVEVLCGFEVSQAQVSDAAKLLDVEIEKWRNRPLGAFRYLVLDATYEKVRLEQAVVSGAVLIAYGVDNNGKRRVLGISTEISEAEVHWRAFLKSLVDRGLPWG
jgi:putative transposase